MSELDVQRRMTRAFIEKRGAVSLTLTPLNRVSNGAGGWRLVPGVARPPITATLISVSPQQAPVRTPEGETDAPDFVLLAEYGATVQEDDFWSDGNFTYHVTHIYSDTLAYETKAGVVRRGR